MKKLLMCAAMALPLLGLVSCGGGESAVSNPGVENEEMHGGDGPIEEPVLAFYESPQSVKSMEKRKLVQNEEAGGIRSLTYRGATSAVAVTYIFGKDGLNSAGTVYENKNKDRLHDFLCGKYTLIEKEGDNRLQLETKDHLVSVGVTTTPASTNVVYMRQYTREQEKARWAEPFLVWGAGADAVRAAEVRKPSGGTDGELVFESAGYAGRVSYMVISEPVNLGLSTVTVYDVPGLHYGGIVEGWLAAGYTETEPVAGMTCAYLSPDGKTKVNVHRQSHTQYMIMYMRNGF